MESALSLDPAVPGEADAALELERLRFERPLLVRLARLDDPHLVLAALAESLEERLVEHGLVSVGVAVVERVASPRQWELRACAGLPPETQALLQDPGDRPALTGAGWRGLQRGALWIADCHDSPFLDAHGFDPSRECSLLVHAARSPEGVVIGAVVVVLQRSSRPEDHVRPLLEAAAELAGQTLERMHAEPDGPAAAGTDALIDGVTALLIVLDPRGRIVQLNRAFERAFGRDSAELLGSHVGDLVLESHRESLDAWLAAVTAGTTGLQYEGCWRTGQGQERWVGWVASALHDRRGRLRYVVCTGADITDRRRAEREREKVQQALLHLQKMEAIEVLVDGFVHDFNNSLTAIIGFADLAQASLAEDHPARRSLEELLNAAKLATSQTGSLLNFTRSAGVHRGPCDLVEILDSCRPLLRHALPRSISLDWGPAPDDHLLVVADPNQVRQVLVALAINARDAMPEGGHLRVEARPAPGTPLPGGGTAAVALTVSDDGHGIPPEHLGRVFQPFFTTKLRGRGSGLGLPGVRRIVEEHGGRVELESRVGEGTLVRVLLPAAAPDGVGGASDDRGPAHVLVADAENLARSVVVTNLRRAGMTVSLAPGLPEVVETDFLERRDFDLLLLDASSLPPDPAADLLELWGRLPDIRVLVLGDPEARLSTDPRLRVLPRPFTMATLTRAVQEHLADPRRSNP